MNKSFNMKKTISLIIIILLGTTTFAQKKETADTTRKQSQTSNAGKQNVPDVNKGKEGGQGSQNQGDKNDNQGKQDVKIVPGASGVKRSIGYKFSSLLTDGDPGNGIFRYNSNAISSVTYVFVDNYDIKGEDQTKWYETWDDSTGATGRGRINIVEYQGKNVNVFDVTDVFVNGKGFWKIPVKYVSGSLPAVDSVYFYVFERIENKKEKESENSQTTPVTPPIAKTDTVTSPPVTPVITTPPVTPPVELVVTKDTVTAPPAPVITTPPVTPPVEPVVTKDTVTAPPAPVITTPPVTPPVEPVVTKDTVTAPPAPVITTPPVTPPVEPVVKKDTVTAPPAPVITTPPVTPPVEPVVTKDTVTAPPAPVITTPPVTPPVEQPVVSKDTVAPPVIPVIAINQEDQGKKPVESNTEVQPEETSDKKVLVRTRDDKVTKVTDDSQKAPPVKPRPETQGTEGTKVIRDEQKIPAAKPVESAQKTQSTQVAQPSQPKSVTQPEQSKQIAQQTQSTETSQKVQTTQQTQGTQSTQTAQGIPAPQQKQGTQVSQGTQSTQRPAVSTVPQPGQVTSQNYYGTAGGRSGKCYRGIIEIGYALRISDYGINNFRFNFINGFNIRNTSIGLGIGVRKYFDKPAKHPDWHLVSGDVQIPVFLDVRTHFSSKKVTPYLGIGIGNSTGFDSDTTNNKPEGLYFHATGGVWFNLSDRFAVFGGFAYETQRLEFADFIDEIPYKKYTNSVSLNIGIAF